jgi:hypothetical protein
MEQLIYLLIFLVIYFFPSLVAQERSKKNTTAIFVTNLFFGWTFVGWVIVLIWSLMKD